MVYKIAVVGAGIGGLAAASYLAKAGHDVTLFDQFDTPAPLGSGLVVQPVGQAVLGEIDALELALAHGHRVTAMEGLEVEDGRKVLAVDYGAGFGLAIHRASLFHALFEAAKAAGARIVTDARVSGIAGDHVAVGGDRHGPYDLIVNASGANSPLSPLQSRPLPYGAVWGTVPWPEASALPRGQLQQRYKAASRMIGILPVGTLPGSPQEIATIFWSLPREGYDRWLDTPLDDWKAEATALWPEMAPFLEGIRSHDDMTMATYTHGALLKPAKGRVVHLGDAAHRTSPQLGQGANMALLDACALARALRDPDLDMALSHYTKARRGHVWLYQLISGVFTPQYQSDSRVLPWLRDRVLFPLSQIAPVPRILTRLVCGNLVPPLGSLSARTGL